jgi:hypothetical protein
VDEPTLRVAFLHWRRLQEAAQKAAQAQQQHQQMMDEGDGYQAAFTICHAAASQQAAQEAADRARPSCAPAFTSQRNTTQTLAVVEKAIVEGSTDQYVQMLIDFGLANQHFSRQELGQLLARIGKKGRPACNVLTNAISVGPAQAQHWTPVEGARMQHITPSPAPLDSC